MSDSRRERPTLPPAIVRGEDSPPLAEPRQVSRPDGVETKETFAKIIPGSSNPLRNLPKIPPALPPESIAKMALRAPPPPPGTNVDHEAVLRALAQTEEHRKAFEESVRAELHRVVVASAPTPPAAQVKSIAPPPRGAPDRDLSWMAHVPAILMAVGALIATTTQNCQKKAEVSADVLAKITEVNSKLEAHVTAHTLDVVNQHAKDQARYTSDLDERCYLAGALKKLGFKVDDPPQTPACPEMEFYPAPARGSSSPWIQPKTTFPAPPAP